MPSPQTNAAVLLAQADRLMPDEIDLAARARTTWLTVTGKARSGLLELIIKTPLYWIIARLRSDKAHRSDPLELLDRIIVQLANAGWTEAQLRPLEIHVGETITMRFAGTARRSVLAIDMDEQQLEGQENDLQTRRLAALAAGQTPDPDALDQEALALRLEASLGIEKARVIEADARAIRAGRQPRMRVARVPEGLRS